jgi:phosphate-selective porin OprO and OprP
MDFWCEYDFANTDTLQQNSGIDATGGLTANRDPATGRFITARRVINTPVPTDLWAQFRNPYANVRIGNLKPAISFEHNTSSRFLNFLERSYAFDAYVGGPDNGFTPGVLVFRNFADDRVHLSASVTRFNQTVFGVNTGDGELQGCLRVGAFPIYDQDGRCAVWVGCGYRHNDSDFLVGNSRQFSPQTDGQIRLRARTLLRNGPAELHTPLLDIFPFASSQDLIVPEFAAVFGPLTIQGEYFGSWVHDARATVGAPPGVTQFTQSAYVEALYFLTGEHRVFNRQIPGFGRVVPYENFWLVKDNHGGPYLGRGAWQVGARYSWIDLADQGVLGGNNTIGSAQSLTLGLNWFLNPNTKVQWNYTYEKRYQINTVGAASPNAGLLPLLPSDGHLQGFGMRLAFDF